MFFIAAWRTDRIALKWSFEASEAFWMAVIDFGRRAGGFEFHRRLPVPPPGCCAAVFLYFGIQHHCKFKFWLVKGALVGRRHCGSSNLTAKQFLLFFFFLVHFTTRLHTCRNSIC